MLAIIELVFFVLLLPYIMFGQLLAHVADLVSTYFEPKLLLVGAWFVLVAVFLFPSKDPDDSPFVSVVDAIAQSHIAGLQTPTTLFGFGTFLVVVSALVAAKHRRTT